MIIESIKKQMNDYDIKEVTEHDYLDVFQIYQSNKEFNAYTSDQEITFEKCVEDILSRPEGIERDQKHYLAFYDDKRILGVLDFLVDFPKKNTIFIGLLLIDGNQKRKGIGRNIVNHLIQVFSEESFESIQLGVIEKNTIALHFWRSFGFREIRKTNILDDNNNKVEVVVMELDIKK